MDLTTQFPRAGEEHLAGYPWLPRAIDKCRAYIAGTIGDYIFPCPIDMQMLTELNVTEDEFEEAVRNANSDEEVLANLGIPLVNTDPRVERWAQEFLENRRDSLRRQAEEEGRAQVGV
ncbi:MAG: DUF5069 domain-containing protein [Armatimonadota bacterium]|nr:DUF5069 domain-containing protein [Armatimonadota bacterium]